MFQRSLWMSTKLVVHWTPPSTYRLWGWGRPWCISKVFVYHYNMNLLWLMFSIHSFSHSICMDGIAWVKINSKLSNNIFMAKKILYWPIFYEKLQQLVIKNNYLMIKSLISFWTLKKIYLYVDQRFNHWYQFVNNATLGFHIATQSQ